MLLGDIWGNEQAKRAIEITEKGKLSIKFIGNGEAKMLLDYCREKNIAACAFKPCECGNYGDDRKECRCSIKIIKEYQNKIENAITNLTVKTKNYIDWNAIKLPYKLVAGTEELLKAALERWDFNQNETLSILRVAETIATISNCRDIKPEHLAEALQYRNIE